MIKGVFSLIKKVLFIEPKPKYTNCLVCGKELKGSQKKFCSKKSCNNTYWRNKYKNETYLKLLKGGL